MTFPATVPPPDSITVVIPTFNRREWLQRAVRSVLAETRVPIVVRVFDNASTDDTAGYVAALRAADARVQYVRNQSNIGATPNYIQALASVDTEYFVPLADDDWLLPDFLFEAWTILRADAELGAAVFVTEARNAAGEVQHRYPSALDRIRFGRLSPREHLTDWLNHGHYAWSSILWRRKARDVVGYPYLKTGLPSDVDFQLQAFCHFPVHMDRRAGAVYSLHDNQASGAYDQRELVSWARVFARLDRTVSRLGLFPRDEYLTLRQVMQWRYRGMWIATPPEPLTPRQAARAAIGAGFRLGDWDTAWSVAATIAPGVIDAAPGRATHQLPGLGSLVTREVVERTDADATPLLLGVARWFRLAHETFAVSQQQLAAVQQQLAEANEWARTQAATAAAQELAHAQREQALQEEISRLQATCGQLSARLETVHASPLCRWMQALGLVRLPARP